MATTRKQAALIAQLNKERLQSKKQLIETSFARKTAESGLHTHAAEIASLKNELKAKGEMLLALEKDRRRAEQELTRLRGHFDRTTDTPVAAVRPRPRSVSADRLSNLKAQYSKQLLIKSSSPTAYHATKSDDESSVDGKELEKVVLLQKLLLQKSKQLIERDVRVEQLENLCAQQSQIIARLKRAKQFAEELTATRHKLNIRNNQLHALRDECSKNKAEVTALRAEVARLREKLAETYNERLYFS